jgi:hypothetical protein
MHLMFGGSSGSPDQSAGRGEAVAMFAGPFILLFAVGSFVAIFVLVFAILTWAFAMLFITPKAAPIP